MVYTVNRSTAAVLDKLAGAPRIGELGLVFSAGWHEKNDRTKGFFDSDWGVPESWQSVILQGPHLYVATPFYKTPNATMASNKDWTATDFEALAGDSVPATAYKPRGDRDRYDQSYATWDSQAGPRSARDFYRVAWRRMAANTGERTLTPAVIPPGAAHINGVHSIALGGRGPKELVAVSGWMSSLLADSSVRATPKSEILLGVVSRLPFSTDIDIQRLVLLRNLRLNCVTSAYSQLWADCFDEAYWDDSWADTDTYLGRVDLADVGSGWTMATPLRRSLDRRQAQLEIDALVALSLDVTVDELCAVYRTQFPVLYGYDRNRYFYDANGRLVPAAIVANWRTRGRNGGQFAPEELKAVHPSSGVAYTYELPFATRDRERDLRVAYRELQWRLAARTSNSV
jgi:hypothetical protein